MNVARLAGVWVITVWLAPQAAGAQAPEELPSVPAEFGDASEDLDGGAAPPTPPPLGREKVESKKTEGPARSDASTRCAKGYDVVKSADYAVGEQALHVLVADFNGDGKPDLAVSNTTATTAARSSVNILLNKGGGEFVSGAAVLALSPYASAAGDFDEDGKVDLLVAEAHQSANVRLFPGKGDGSFRSLVDIDVGAYGAGLAVADFNRDGHADFALAFAAASMRSAALFRGKGDGTFAAGAVAGPLPAAPTALAMGDLNLDGVPDVVTVGEGTVAVFLAKRDGTLDTPVTRSVPAKLRAAAIGDFNKDGKADAATVDTKEGRALVFLGQGNGELQKPSYFDVGKIPRAIAATDLDRDGNQDLIVANAGSDTLSILSGTGTGSFASQRTIDIADGPSALAVADFSGDGVVDLAVSRSQAKKLTLLLGTCR